MAAMMFQGNASKRLPRQSAPGFSGSGLSASGLTLIEVMISFALLSLILATTFTFNLFILSQNKVQAESLREEQNLRMAMDAVEKRLREMDQQSLVYFPHQQTFRCQMKRPDQPGTMNVWLDFSGQNRNRLNTWLYFDKTSGTLRVNKKQEHNVLHRGIRDVTIEEVEPGKLIRVTLTGESATASSGEISQEMTLRVTYGREEP